MLQNLELRSPPIPCTKLPPQIQPCPTQSTPGPYLRDQRISIPIRMFVIMVTPLVSSFLMTVNTADSDGAGDAVQT